MNEEIFKLKAEIEENKCIKESKNQEILEKMDFLSKENQVLRSKLA